jgi:hypothetical protein
MAEPDLTSEELRNGILDGRVTGISRSDSYKLVEQLVLPL